MININQVETLALTLVRIAVSVRRIEFRHRFEKASFDLVERVAEGDLESLEKTLNIIEALTRLGMAMYEVESMNGKFILEESSKVREYIPKIDPELDLGKEIKKTEDREESPKNQEKAVFVNNPAKESGNPAIRQEEIVDKIRKFENQPFQIKDCLLELPNRSERSIRYDLQRLCSEGIIERFGGGPATYYRFVTKSLASSSVITS